MERYEFDISKFSEEITIGDLVAITDNCEVKKVSEQSDLFRILGVATEVNDNKVILDINGLTCINTNDTELEIGDLVVAEVDATVKCKTALEDDIDIIGMVIKKPEEGKVLIKLK